MQISRRTLIAASGAAILAAALAPYAALAQANPEALAAAGPLPDQFIGQPNAPVTIIEYASMTCPHCATFHTQTFPQLKAAYLDTGKARFVLREFPLDPAAAAAFMLARCAAGDETRLGSPTGPAGSAERYYAVVDALFAQQRTWASAQNVEQSLFDVARQAGFSRESFQACLTNQKLYEAVTQQGERAAKQFEVRSTPTFFVNGKLQRGALTFAEFSKLIDAELRS